MRSKMAAHGLVVASVVAFAVAACGAPDPGVRSSLDRVSAAKDQSPEKEAPPACIPTPDAAAITHAATDGNRVLYCVGNDASCFAVENRPRLSRPT